MKTTRLIILFSALVAISHQSVNYRLPTDSLPHHYKLKFIPHIIPGNFTFSGESEIDLEVLRTTRNLTLHSLNLRIHEESTFLIGNERKIMPIEHVIDKEREFLILLFSNDLQPGNYTLHFKYDGELNQYNSGFFVSFYLDENNEKVYFATTFFEATQARLAFPCWDEPAMKATFDISIKHFPNYTALSNMPVEKIIDEKKIDGKIWTDFETTPVMSTYIVSFIISDFENCTNPEKNFTFWYRKGALDFVNLGYNVGLKALPVLEEYTNISYQIPKLDVVAIPFFENGGMENWGLIIFREDFIFQNNQSSTTEILESIKYMVHEINHQWFGNLVTHAWWNDIWLTEGLATYLHFFLTGKITGNTRFMELFNLQNNYKVFTSDYFPTKLVAPTVNTPVEIHDLLNGVHEKAATIIQMLSDLISEKVFHSGVRKLLKKYQFKTITADDFWKSMQEALDESKLPHNFDIKKVMDSYLYKAGFPVVNVIRDYEKGVVKLSQKCIVCEQLDHYPDLDNAKWWIPINFVTNSSLNFSSTFPTHWMNPEDEELIIEGIHPDDWIIVNIQRSGYYRVNYDATNWKKISDYLNSDKYLNIHVLNRAQIIEDASFQDQENALEPDILRSIISYLKREVDYVPWFAAFQLLDFYVYNVQDEKSFTNYTVELLDAVIKDAGLPKENEDIFTTLKRNQAFEWTCIKAKKNCPPSDSTK